jgi:hypothetical protein
MAVSRKDRFTIFKRDLFKCQYCGQMPPAVVLELDHIIPKSKGGKDVIENYITSCFDCNRGKGKHKLTAAPNALLVNSKLSEEQSAQIKEYIKWTKQLRRQNNALISQVVDVFTTTFPNWIPSEQFKKVSIAQFIKRLPLVDVVDAMELACSKLTITQMIKNRTLILIVH